MVSIARHIRFSRGLLFSAALGLSTCAAPEEPGGLQQAPAPGSATKKEDKPVDKSDKATFNFGGAQIGDDTTKTAVKECVDKGFFYERSDQKTVGCTPMKLAKLNCTDDGVKASMSNILRQTYEKLFNTDDITTSLKGFVVDQCLDCPTWDANDTCKELAQPKKGNEQKRPGVIINLVKLNGAVIELRRVFSPNP